MFCVCIVTVGELWPHGWVLAMSQQDVSTASTLQLVAADMSDIMENLDTRELDIGDGEDVFEGPGTNSAGEREGENRCYTGVITHGRFKRSLVFYTICDASFFLDIYYILLHK